MTDWGEPFRVDEFRAYLVDPFSLEPVGEVGVDWASSSVTYNYGGDVVCAAKVKLASGCSNRVGGRSMLVRLVDEVSIPGDEPFERVLGTFFARDSGSESLFSLVNRSLDCYGTRYRHVRDRLVNDFQRLAAKKCTVASAIRDLIEADAGTVRFSPDANTWATFGSDAWFELGSCKMDVADSLACLIGNELYPDDDGSLLLRRSPDPSSDAPVYTFESGMNCVYKSGIGWSSNRSEILNRVIYVLSNSDTTDRAVAELPPASLFSFQNTGMHCTEVVTVSEAPVGGLQQAAESYLAEHSIESENVEIEHVFVPTLRVGDVVRYVNDTDHSERVDVVAQVVQMDIPSLTPLAMTKTKLKIARWS